MKKPLLTVVFVFSLVLNAAVAATVVWHVWRPEAFPTENKPAQQALTEKDFDDIRRNCKKSWRTAMKEHRQKVVEKNLEILDLVAKNPGNPQAADKAVEELIALRAEAERKAVAMTSSVMASLPEEKRESFVLYMKNRACLGKGFGPGKGKWRQRIGDFGCPPGMGPQ